MHAIKHIIWNESKPQKADQQCILNSFIAFLNSSGMLYEIDGKREQV